MVTWLPALPQSIILSFFQSLPLVINNALAGVLVVDFVVVLPFGVPEVLLFQFIN
jgi:hypothetical protein